MTEETYNGYTNRETHDLFMVLDNSRETHEELREIAKRYAAKTGATLSHLMDELKSYVEKIVEDGLGPSGRVSAEPAATGVLLVSQYVSAAIAEVDWLAVAHELANEVGVDDDEIERKREAWTHRAVEGAF